MNRASIRKMIHEFSENLDDASLKDFVKRMEQRLNKKRCEGRSGWELMTDDELGNLIASVLLKGGGDMFADLANLAMFCWTLEYDPKVVSNIVKRACIDSDELNFSVDDIKATRTPEPDVEAEVNEIAACLVDGAEYLISLANSKKLIDSVYTYDSLNETFHDGGMLPPISAKSVTDIVPVTPSEPQDGKFYKLKVGNQVLPNKYRYFENTSRFREVGKKDIVLLEGKAFDAYDQTITWELLSD